MKKVGVMVSKVALLTFLLLLNFMLVECGGSTNEEKQSKNVQPGQYYSFQCDNGKYKVLKVLVAQEKVIHVCFYNNNFEERPTDGVIESLYFGRKRFFNDYLDVENGRQTTGRKHIALTLKNWEYWSPQFLTDGELDPNELAAYEEWKKGDRYVSGLLVIPTN